jgi:hypothetical protein
MKKEKCKRKKERLVMRIVCFSVAIVFVQSFMIAQEESSSDWKIMPSISVTKLFSLGHRNNSYDVQPLIYPTIGRDGFTNSLKNFSATGVSFNARFLNKDFEPFAFTLSAGANWFRHRDQDSPIPYSAISGPAILVGDSTRMPMPDVRGYRGGFGGRENRGFMSFPVSLGAQVLFPYEKIDKLMFFAGVEGNLHFMSERGFTRRQVEAGFSAVGGIAIKMFEFSVRYSRFAEQNNIGLQAGIRFNQFEL